MDFPISRSIAQPPSDHAFERDLGALGVVNAEDLTGAPSGPAAIGGFIASRIRWAMSHADLRVIPRFDAIGLR